jgi:hypothetical protein
MKEKLTLKSLADFSLGVLELEAPKPVETSSKPFSADIRKVPETQPSPPDIQSSRTSMPASIRD